VAPGGLLGSEVAMHDRAAAQLTVDRLGMGCHVGQVFS
jgi:hypothetical protein